MTCFFPNIVEYVYIYNMMPPSRGVRQYVLQVGRCRQTPLVPLAGVSRILLSASMLGRCSVCTRVLFISLPMCVLYNTASLRICVRYLFTRFLFRQGQDIEMEDKDYTGFKFTGTLQGTTIACHCGCERTLPGAALFVHLFIYLPIKLLRIR